jgi:hypothetical protein
MAGVAEGVEEANPRGEFSDEEHREYMERARWLATAICDTKAGSACSVSPLYYEALLDGLGDVFTPMYFEAKLMSKHDPLGQRYIAWHSVEALWRFIDALEALVEAA